MYQWVSILNRWLAVAPGIVSFVGWTLMLSVAAADGPRDNVPEQVRSIPPVGVEISDADRSELQGGLDVLGGFIDQLRKLATKNARVGALLPDVEIYHRAVSLALGDREFFKPTDVTIGKSLVAQGRSRAEQLLAGEAPWTRQTGLVVRGFRSRLDDTAQPYGLVIPASYTFEGAARHRCDLWFHGRGETICEVNFIDQRQKQIGPIAPRDTIVLHPFGRYSNAFKLAGEVDVLEALEAVRQNYRVDDDRVVVRGFSMGGAGAWHLAVHDPTRWAAANPGAGFSETPRFLKVFQQEQLAPPWYEQTLWRQYDCDLWARNLLHCPTIAYSGELDLQKQAADVMEEALAKQGIRLTHLIGPQTKHALHPGTLGEVERRLESIVAGGREPLPRVVDFVTYTLRYNRCSWVTVEGLGEHWEKAQVFCRLSDDSLHGATSNVTALRFDMPAGRCPLPQGANVKITLDTQELTVPGPMTDRSWTVGLKKVNASWQVDDGPANSTANDGRLVKRPGLQGPIDDALLDSFIFVRPTGRGTHEAVENWATAELEHAMLQWRRQMRGTARVVDDTKLTDAQVASHHLVLWGTPESNAVLKRIAGQLPIEWNAAVVKVAGSTYPANAHAPVLVYPNPLNPNRYVVLNSSFTYREYDYLNNARQVPKLPDWAIVDVRTPPSSRSPGKIVAADFFDERWKLKPVKQ